MYLGFLLGPAVEFHSFEKPWLKVKERTRAIARVASSINANVTAYNRDCVSVMSHVMALQVSPDYSNEQRALVSAVLKTPFSAISQDSCFRLGELGIKNPMSFTVLEAAIKARVAYRTVEWSELFCLLYGSNDEDGALEQLIPGRFGRIPPTHFRTTPMVMILKKHNNWNFLVLR